jgi:hypothetical protein
MKERRMVGRGKGNGRKGGRKERRKESREVRKGVKKGKEGGMKVKEGQTERGKEVKKKSKTNSEKPGCVCGGGGGLRSKPPN